MLQLQAISKNFGGLQVLQDVSFTMPEGSIFGLIGPNGAGKTTIVNLITGLLRPSSGEIRFNDQDLSVVEPHKLRNSASPARFRTSAFSRK
jgi:branched-chain amino acid transport system ATP-binding protein